jgi:4-methyl-5(b-hydroxyethyl)-thiazole monophosphate biosynthesis
MNKVAVFLAEGFEEVEALTPIDYLRRAGVEVVVLSVTRELTVKGSHGVRVLADDTVMAELPRDYDAVVLPGGMPGAANLAESKRLDAVLCEAAASGKLICAICASPAVVLAPKGHLEDRRYTCYPGMETDVKDGRWQADDVVVDKNIITSRGPGTAGEFALTIIEKLAGKDTADKIRAAVLIQKKDF